MFSYSAAIRETIYAANMDSNPGWTLDPGSAPHKWGWGQPTGDNGDHGNSDPLKGYTGNNVVGYNLSGGYLNGMTATQWATTPVINCSQFGGVELQFYRWLNTQYLDRAPLEVFDGVSWTRIWLNSVNVTDSSWTLQVFDISSIADGRSTVYVRWGTGPTNSSWYYSGWNINDVVVSGVPRHHRA